jgi:starch-binding outer membrane protein, SusD/RagB family
MKPHIHLVIAICSLLAACETFLSVEPPISKIPTEVIYQDDEMAIAAVTGIYTELYSPTGFAGGTNVSVVTLAGLSADELRNNKSDPISLAFQNNTINPNNENVLSVWRSAYKAIYLSNAALEGLESADALTANVRKRLQGESFFARAFCYFYLVNLFGNVPLAVSTDYKINSSLHRASIDAVYDQIKNDLLTAEELLDNSYSGLDRIRPNKAAASALLSRVYLFTDDWPRAEDKASKIISNSTYDLVELDRVFLSSSKEAIWQLRPNDDASYTNEGYWFGESNGPQFNILKESILENFETGDRRRDHWIKSIGSEGSEIYLPFKYKRHLFSGLTDEYSMAIRLAEVYLIRAEARAKQEKLALAILDVDAIRERAGLPSIQIVYPDIDTDKLLDAIQHERRVEFMTEWGHRWFDLKRTGDALNILAADKIGLTADDLLYPIPQAEIGKNLNLEPQNTGY